MIALVVLLAGCGAPQHPSPGHQAHYGPPAIRGVAYHGTWASRDDAARARILDAIAASGVGWVRMDVAWKDLQPDGPGTFDAPAVDRLDRRLNEIADRGLKVLIMFWWAPAWSSGTTDQNGAPGNPQDYATAAAWMVKRWPDRIAALEVWNEPNLPEFFAHPDPAAYAQILAATYPRVKAENPDLTVVSAAPSGIDLAWYAGFLDTPTAQLFDVIGAHPYPKVGDVGPADCERHADNGCDVGGLVSLLADRGLADKPIWVTEFGWSTHGDFPGMQPWQRGVTEQQQAQNTAGMLAVFGRIPEVQAAFVYRDEDFTNSDPHRNGFGILRSNGDPKPVYDVLTCPTIAACDGV